MNDDWAKPASGYRDLETKADEIYTSALEQFGCAEKTTEQAKMLDVALKAIRLQAELRMRDALPAEVEELRALRDEIVEAINQASGASTAYIRTPEASSGDPSTH